MNESSSLLKPAWWQAALTLLVLTVFTVVLVLGVSGLAATFSPRQATLGSLLCLFFVPVVPVLFLPVKWQYRGTFQGDPASARKASFAWGLIAVLSLLIIHTSWLFLSVGGLGLANWCRYRQLQQLHAKHPELQGIRRNPKGESRVWFGILCVAVCFFFLLLPSSPETVEHVDAEQVGIDLPEGATDVSYTDRFYLRAFEFTTDEQRFRKWITSERYAPEAGAQGGFLVEIDEPCRIVRYRLLATRKVDAPLDEDDQDYATLTDGLCYGWGIEDRGVHAAFDRKTGRGYMYIHTK
jgi:hypothetical protein